MSTTTTLIVAFFSLFLPKDVNDCQVAYQGATLSYQHIKKSMEANNLDHIRQYAGRAKASLEKTQLVLKNCGCVEAENASFETLEQLEKSLEKETFERSRYHVSKAKVSVQQILTTLDVCAEKGLLSTIDEEEETLLSQEEELLAQQRRLQEQQEKLAKQLKKQKELQQRLQNEKEEKLARQLAIKRDAEASLNEMKSAILKATQSLECPTDALAGVASYSRSEEILETETVQATRLFYAQKMEEMVQLFLNTLEGCE